MIARYIIIIWLPSSILFASLDSTINKKKDPKHAFLFSAIPGMGQIYNGKWIKSALILGFEVTSYLAWRENSKRYTEYENNNYPLKRHRYLEKRNKFAWWIGIIYIYAMIDAVVDAHLHSFDQLMDSPLKQNVNEEIDYEK